MPTNEVREFLSPACIDRHLSQLFSQGYSTNSIRAYKADITAALSWIEDGNCLLVGCPPDSVDELETALADYLTQMRVQWSPKTTNRKLSALRSYAKFCGVSVLKNYRPMRDVSEGAHCVPGGIDSVRKMITFAKTPQQRALIGLCGFMGLRVSEAVAVRPSHFNLVDRELSVVGKGNKRRIIPISPEAWEAISPALAAAVSTDATIVRFGESMARKVVTKLGIRADLPRAISSHDLRATLATSAYQNGNDIRAVQKILGHSNIRTTQIYVSTSMDEMRKAITL